MAHSTPTLRKNHAFGRPLAPIIAVCAVALAGCASVERPSVTSRVAQAPEGMAFSSARAGEAFPAGWQPYTVARFKKPTDYRLMQEDGRTVVRAEAHASASGMFFKTSADLAHTPQLAWRWKVPALIPGADSRKSYAEDSPARIVVTFDGDKDELPFDDKLVFSQAKAIAGVELPYATLMYIWSSEAPVGTVISHHLTSRIKMIVVESGPARLGQWLDFKRNVREDFEKAFGEPAARVSSVGIFTDADNTGKHALAYYGDLAFREGGDAGSLATHKPVTAAPVR